MSRLGKVGWLVCSSLHWSFFSGLKLFSSIFCMFEIFGNFKDGMCREITAKKVWSQHWPVACAGPSELTESWHVWSHSLVTQAWQALNLSTGEGTEAWRDGVTSERPHTGGRSPLTVSCVSGETGKGRRMSERGLPPCKNQSSSNCWPFLFLLSIKDTSENIKKPKGENESDLCFSLSYFLNLFIIFGYVEPLLQRVGFCSCGTQV